MHARSAIFSGLILFSGCSLHPRVDGPGPLARTPVPAAPVSATAPSASAKSKAPESQTKYLNATSLGDYMRKMRTPDGSPVPFSYIDTALRHNAGMRHYSIAQGRFLQPGEIKA